MTGSFTKLKSNRGAAHNVSYGYRLFPICWIGDKKVMSKPMSMSRSAELSALQLTELINPALLSFVPESDC